MRPVIATMVALTVLALVVAAPVLAGPRSGGTISGRVADLRTQEPLANTIVFLSNTLLGTSTAEDGSFTIRAVPPGVYELNVSHVGYSRVVRNVQIFTNDSVYIDIRLETQELQFPEVEVSAPTAHEWERCLKLFIGAFIGTGEFAEKCKIINPQVIEFSFDKKSDTLRAWSDSLIHVHNRALGFSLHVALDEFLWNTAEHAGHYLFQLYFEEMTPISADERSVWGRNRLKVYEGSMSQFLEGLYSGKLSEDDFTMYTGPKVELLHGPSHRVIAEDFESTQFDGIPLKQVQFPANLRVEGGKVERKHIGREWVEYRSQVSILTPRTERVLIDSLGNLFDPLSVEVAGYWSERRLSELLPRPSIVRE